jgi:2-keto-4-pentenoate hydratase/2-oxohepta-3-ene-1,7-dioic acid hydratase in catechol pathway
MRLATVISDNERRACVVTDEGELVLTGYAGVEHVITAGASPGIDGPRVLPSTVDFDAVLRPAVVLCTGHNYVDHYAEKSVNRADAASGLEFFLKAGQTISRPRDPLLLDPLVTSKLDQETELGVVIGRAGRRISEANALDHVFGYTVINDVTARDRQVHLKPDGSYGMELGAAKNFVGSTRLGSEIITADEVDDPQNLVLSTRINGSLRQLNHTGNMIHSVAEIIAYFSRFIPLEPGQIISTGTPGGSGWGQDPELGGNGRTPDGCVPGAYLKPGDEVVSEIEHVGQLSFVVRSDESVEGGAI